MRLDLTNYKVYVIDPPDCTDADDAFGIIDNNLWVFVADPTNEFKINSELYKSILKKGTTKYSLFNKPIHMFPEEIVKKCSLDSGIKNAIGIKMRLSKNAVLNSEIHLVKIKIGEHLTYYNTPIDNTIKRCLAISKRLFIKRVGKGKILNDYQVNLPVFKNSKWVFKKDTKEVIELKHMIAEFAIKCNQIVSQKLKLNLNRICNSIKSKNPNDLIFKIIQNGIKAQYKLSDKKHLLIDNKTYTHFTSPLRRANDCLVHFLLKGEKIDLNELDTITNNINEIIKQDKKKQYNEIKKCNILAMKELLNNGPINIKIKILSYSGLFLNMIIYQVNEFNTQFSVCLRIKNYKGKDNDELEMKLTKIYSEKKYDNEIFPEIEKLIL